MLKRKLIIALLAVTPFISNICSAERPSKCPSIESLSSLEFDSASLTNAFPGKWYVMQINHSYETNVKWDFAIVVNANNHDDALIQAKMAVPMIENPLGPVDAGAGYYMCEYNRPGQPEAIAFYPSGANSFRFK